MWQRLLRRSAKEKQLLAKDLLQELLLSPAPTEGVALRPVVLRSLAAQRQVALSRFLLRAWFDEVLKHGERVLCFLLLGVMAIWLFETYGPVQGQEKVAADLVRQPLSQASLPALPFTESDFLAKAPSPDYLVPQAMALPATPLDQRPQHLQIATIGVDTVVKEVFIEDGVWQVADYAAGYHHGTGLPGEKGNVVLSGHAGLRGGVFRNLPALQVGAEVLLDAGGWRYRYRVKETKSVWPLQTEVMDPTSTPTLTLITCTAWDTQRLVVFADLLDSIPL